MKAITNEKNGFKDVSKVLYQDENLNIIIFQWISGTNQSKLTITN